MTLGIDGSGIGGGIKDAGGSTASWFSLAGTGSIIGDGTNFFKMVLFHCFCTPGLSTYGLSVLF